MRVTIFVLMLSVLAIGTHARAEEAAVLDRWSLAAGGFAVNVDADVRVDGTTETGRDVDLSRDLGVNPDKRVGYFSVGWRPFEHHQFDFSYFSDSNSGTRSTDREITIGDETFVPGTELHTDFGVDTYDFAYTWWIKADRRQAIGLQFGLIDYSIDLHVQTEGGVGGGRDVSASADLPAPKIGFGYRLAFGSGWRFVAGASAFKANIGAVDARVTDARAAVEYYPWDRFGVRLQYSLNRIHADVDESDYDGKVALRSSGVQLQVVARFQ